MKKQFLTIIVLLLFFAIFNCLQITDKNEFNSKILKVVDGDEFYIDFNGNGKIEENELSKLADIKVFSSSKNKEIEDDILSLNISFQDYLKLGLLAESWAIKNLENKDVKVKILSRFPINLVEIEFDDKNLSQHLLELGLGYIDNSSDLYIYQNNSQIKKNLEKLTSDKYLILKLKSNIFHELSCKYSKNITNARIFLKSDFNKEKYFPCKACLEKVRESSEIFTYNIPKNKNKYNSLVYKSFGDVELFFVNPLVNKRPQKACLNTLCKRIVQEIDSANSSIDVALYGIGMQQDVINALKRAKQRGVKIRMVLDFSKNMHNIFPLSLPVSSEFDTVFDNDKSLMHNKFFIFDNKKVLTGSTNLSSAGVGGYNANISLLIKSDKLASFYKQEFEQMFSAKFSKNKAFVATQSISVGNITITPYFSPKSDILNSLIIPVISSAKNEIFVSAFYLTDRKIISELISAKQRGVNVIVLLDALSAKNMNDRTIMLRNSGIPLKAENWGGKNHEKTMVIDSKILITGSCNFSSSGLAKNDENILQIENQQIASFYRDYYLYLFNSINDTYLTKVPRAEGFDSKNSCFDGIDNNYDGKIDSEDLACKSKSK